MHRAGDGDLVALPRIAHVERAFDADLIVAKFSALRSAQRLACKLGEYFVDVRLADLRERRELGADVVVLHIRHQQAHRGDRRRDRAARRRPPCRALFAIRAACSGPRRRTRAAGNRERSWPRMVEMALIASCIFTSMMRTMPSAASSTLSASFFATCSRPHGGPRRNRASSCRRGNCPRRYSRARRCSR